MGGVWAILDDGQMWLRGHDAIDLDAPGARLQSPAARGDAILVAHESGLTSVTITDLSIAVVHSADGVPTAPVVVGADAFAAWLPRGEGPGVLWSSRDGAVDLDYGGLEIDADPESSFQVQGDQVILNEVSKGWVWTVPDGRLVPLVAGLEPG